MAVIELRIGKNGKRSYRAKVRISGYPAACATFAGKAQAKAWAAVVEAEMRSGKYQSDIGCNRKVGEMIDKYLATMHHIGSGVERYQQAKRRQLLWFKRHIGDYALSNVTPFVLADMRDLLLKRVSIGTMHNYFASITHVLNVAVKEWGWLQSNPATKMRKPSKPNGRVRYLSDEERVRLLNVCEFEQSRSAQAKPIHTLVMLALCTGARKSELLGVKCADVDLQRGYMVVHQTKNKASRQLRLSPEVLPVVRTLMRPDAVLLFQHPRTDAAHYMEDVWRLVRTKAGLNNFHFHDLRHSCASYLAKEGASPLIIADTLGHKTLNMAKKYAHLSESHTAVAIDNMSAKFLTNKSSQINCIVQ